MQIRESDKLRDIKSLRELIPFLRKELDWPIDSDDIEDVTYDFTPEELGIDAAHAVKIREIKQLRPLQGQQPWGVFWVSFEKKKLPIVVLRRILRALVLKKRAQSAASQRAAWQVHDLLFLSAYGESDHRELAIAHFSDADTSPLPTLRVLQWDDEDAPLKLDATLATLKLKLKWDANFGKNHDLWRRSWASAFQLRPGHVICTSKELAEALALCAKRLRNRLKTILRYEDGFGQMRKLQRAFQQGLIHDLDDEAFADMFAQTITYGLFSVAVRRTVPGEGTAFAKDDALHYFTSPFLHDMLGIFLGLKSRKGGIDFDELGVSDVTDLLQDTDTHMEAILAEFGNKTQGEDPVIHFYEHFLAAYNKKLKVQRGVFYTPKPVVSYIVRSVHELLQNEFGLEDGLASTITWGEMIARQNSKPETENSKLVLPPFTDEPGEKRTISPDEMFVQILDPATGTATFLVEVIEVVHKHLQAKWERGGLAVMPKILNLKSKILNWTDYWNAYVPQALLPRLHAYELMMAPYAIAHMKIGLKLRETGYVQKEEIRARIYLTNALEPKVQQLPQIGFEPLADEAKSVNEIKWYKRFTIVIGNPPYSNFGQLNKNPFILGLLEEYKRDLDEKKLNLDDDFIKFIRFSQYLLDRSGTGVFGMITNSTYLDGVTHRQMRASLASSFSLASVFDLHGSSKRQEKNPTGGSDENVFDIQTGVAVSLLTKKNTAFVAAYADLWGSRSQKYAQLDSESHTKTAWTALAPEDPYWFFRPKEMESSSEFQTWPILKDIFQAGGCGIKTERDRVSIHWTAQESREAVEDFRTKSESHLRTKYDLETDSRDWKVANAKADVQANRDDKLFRRVLYRPFDVRHIWYSGQTRGFVGTPGYPTMRHMLDGKNLALLTCRQQAELGFYHVFCTRLLAECCSVSLKTREITSVFPLYVAADETGLKFTSERTPAFSDVFLRSLCAALGLQPQRQHGLPSDLTPEDIFHYVYAVFHSPGYRSRYAEFLKIDFPRLPLTGSLDLFRVLARLGGELTALHLLESPKLDKTRTEFIGNPRTEIEKVGWTPDGGGTVWIDASGKKAETESGSTGFQGVPEAVWNFHIGGYQVCEKWLKDRKGRKLSKDDIAHYHKIIIALGETIRLMKEIDQVIEKHGGWPGAFQAKAS